MGTLNQSLFLAGAVKNLTDISNIIEVGALDVGSGNNFRGKFHGANYVGVDISAGTNVDIVLDFSESNICDSRGWESKFDLAICCSMLEHTFTPWKVADNITKAVKPGGHAYISVPFVWRFHGYPSDYWRFSPECVKALFSEFEVVEMMYATTCKGEFHAIGADPREIDSAIAIELKNGTEAKYTRKYLPYLSVEFLGRKNHV